MLLVRTVFEGGMRWGLKLSWGEFEDFFGFYWKLSDKKSNKWERNIAVFRWQLTLFVWGHS